MTGNTNLNPTQPSPRRSPKEGALDAATLLRSLRRRWVPAVLIGLPLAVAAGVAAFFVVPAPYIAVAEIYFKSYSDNLVFETNEPQADYRIRRETHQRLVTSRNVLAVALEHLDAKHMQQFVGVENPVEWLGDHVDVRRAGEEFFTISLAGESPEEAAAIVNAVANAYISEVVEEEVVKRRERQVALQQVLSGVREELEAKRAALRELAERTKSPNSTQASQKQEFVLDMQIEVRKQIAQVEMELLRLRIRDRVQGGDAPEQQQETIPDDVLESLLAQESEFANAKGRVEQSKRLLAEAERRLAPGHRGISDAKARLASDEAALVTLRTTLVPKIVARLEQEQRGSDDLADEDLPREVERLEAARAELESELDRWKLTEQETGRDTLEIEAATKEIGRLEALNDSLEAELERREFEIKNARPTAQIIEDAIPPTTRSFKKRAAGVAGAAGGAFALVLAGFLFLDIKGGRISTRHDVSEALSLPVIASIPAVPNFAMAKGTGSRRSRRKTVFWTSALKESVDAARTLLLSLAERDGMKTILISSAMPAEGKTTLSLHIATSLARSGRRVILVDADLRRPSLSQVYGAEGPGVCEIVRGEVSLEDAVVKGNVDGLSILPAGDFDEDVLDRVAVDGFGPTLAGLRESYDFVIIDSSPVLPICDGLLFAAQVDGVIFAIRRDVSRRSLVAAALDRFRAIGKPVIGAVAIGLHDDPAGYSQLQRYQSRASYSRALVEC